MAYKPKREVKIFNILTSVLDMIVGAITIWEFAKSNHVFEVIAHYMMK
ncbi:hypothetical protein [Lacihabitans sp. CCS-44]|nr:hypothetical protein [Lacihabitans sp. CCS-44]